MNATMVANGTKAVPPPVSSIQEIPLVKIRESKTNPRRFLDDAKWAHYVALGVLCPLLGISVSLAAGSALLGT